MILSCTLCQKALPDTHTNAWKETNLSGNLLWTTCVCGWINYHSVRQEGVTPMTVGKS